MYLIFVDVVVHGDLINYTIFNYSIKKIRSPIEIPHYRIDVILLNCVQAKRLADRPQSGTIPKLRLIFVCTMLRFV